MVVAFSQKADHLDITHTDKGFQHLVAQTLGNVIVKECRVRVRRRKQSNYGLRRVQNVRTETRLNHS